jgi:hypothetical protein
MDIKAKMIKAFNKCCKMMGERESKNIKINDIVFNRHCIISYLYSKNNHRIQHSWFIFEDRISYIYTHLENWEIIHTKRKSYEL